MARTISTIIIVIAVVASAGHFAKAASNGGTSVLGASHQTCFPAKRWGPAPDRYRPCVRISRLYEDGSFKYVVRDHDGTVRYSGGVSASDR